MSKDTRIVSRYFEWKNPTPKTRYIKKIYIIGEFTNWKPIPLEARTFDNDDGSIYRIKISFVDILSKGVFMYKYVVVTKKPSAIIKEDVQVDWEIDPHSSTCYDDKGNLNNICETLDLSLHEHNSFDHYTNVYEVYGTLDSTINNTTTVSCDGCDVVCNHNFYHCSICNKFDYCEECYKHLYRKNSIILSDPIKRGEWVAVTLAMKLIEDNPPMSIKNINMKFLNDIDRIKDILDKNRSPLRNYLDYTTYQHELFWDGTDKNKECDFIYKLIEMLRIFVYKVLGENTDWHNLKETLKVYEK